MHGIVLFDLDGTLTDPGRGITNSVAYALEKRGITVTDKSALYSFIGPPLAESFEKFYGMSKQEAASAVDDFREYFRPYGIFENEVYPGVREMLSALKASEKKLLVATSKPEVFAVQILRYFELDAYFDGIYGATLDSSRVAKADVIRYALESACVTDKDECVMIGDRHHDIDGALECGLHSIGVTWGYGSEAELVLAGADNIVHTPRDVIRLLLKE